MVKQNTSWISSITISTWFTLLYTFDILLRIYIYAFFIIFVFAPVYITTPYMDVVFRSLVPRYNSCLSLFICRVLGVRLRVRVEVNECRDELGRGQMQWPVRWRSWG